MSTTKNSHTSPTPDLDDDLPVRASCYPMQKVEWLWPGRIPIGKVTLLVGDPGLGKSLLALDAAARVTIATPWPDELPTPLTPSATTDLRQPTRTSACGLANHPASRPAGSRHSTLDARLPGSVLILSAEDKISDTIRPRLAARGADDDRVYFAPSVADLRHDLARLERMLDRIPDCRLIIVDPVNAYVGASDSHFHTIIRKVLAPFAELADRKRIAILAVTHLRKNVGAAIHRTTGSMAFVACARTVWCVARDPENPERNLLLPIKNNLRTLGKGLAYSIAPHDALDAATIDWHAGEVDATAEEVFAASAKKRGPDSIECRAAADWLAHTLAVNPQSAAWVIAEGKHFGFHPRTLRRALHSLGGASQWEQHRHGWTWSLPAPPVARGLAPATLRSSPKPQPTACGLPQPSTPTPPTPPINSPATNPQSETSSPQSPPTPSNPVATFPIQPMVVKETCPLPGISAVSHAPPRKKYPPHLAPLNDCYPPQPPHEVSSHIEMIKSTNETQTAQAVHPLNGHPVISQILWPLRTPPPQLRFRPPPSHNDACPS